MTVQKSTREYKYMSTFFDTITAIATPPGRGGIGIIRCSGKNVETIAQTLLGELPPPRMAQFYAFRNALGNTLDHGLALYFPAPHSFTGEAVLELHGHGSPVVLDQILDTCVHFGARLARPGEFSERAFLNGKIDLVQAEAIADLIDSASQQAAQSALRSLQGEFSSHINQLAGQLLHLRTYIEAGIDFPDEEIDLLADGQVLQQLETILADLMAIQNHARQGYLLREGIRLVIAGRPNVGKSSLLNRLSQRDSAIVTAIPGTTRDIIRDAFNLDGLPVHVCDTAGLRDTDDVVEREGIRRAHDEIEHADVVILLCDERDSPADLDALRELAALPPHSHCLTVYNKCDLSGNMPGEDSDGLLHISAATNAGIEILKNKLKQACCFQSEESGIYMARRRHLDALERTALHLKNAIQQAEFKHSELIAEELRQGHQALGEITGQISSEDLLGEIFSSFCIGK
jgi:tRNA modification GTPase